MAPKPLPGFLLPSPLEDPALSLPRDYEKAAMAAEGKRGPWEPAPLSLSFAWRERERERERGLEQVDVCLGCGRFQPIP